MRVTKYFYISFLSMVGVNWRSGPIKAENEGGVHQKLDLPIKRDAGLAVCLFLVTTPVEVYVVYSQFFRVFYIVANETNTTIMDDMDNKSN